MPTATSESLSMEALLRTELAKVSEENSEMRSRALDLQNALADLEKEKGRWLTFAAECARKAAQEKNNRPFRRLARSATRVFSVGGRIPTVLSQLKKWLRPARA